MKGIDRVLLGFYFSVIAFGITIMVSGHPGFVEMNPILAILFNEFNDYTVILIYAVMWTLIFTLYAYADDRISKYYMNYISNIILLIGFFDLLHNLIVAVKFI